MHAFKGLERLVVLAVDMEGSASPTGDAALRRPVARAMLLHAFLPETAKESLCASVRAFADRQTRQT